MSPVDKGLIKSTSLASCDIVLCYFGSNYEFRTVAYDFQLDLPHNDNFDFVRFITSSLREIKLLSHVLNSLIN